MKISKCTASGQFHYFPRTLLVIFKIFSLVEKQNKRKELIFRPIYQALHGRPSTRLFIPFILRHHPLYLTLSLIRWTEHIHKVECTVICKPVMCWSDILLLLQKRK